jgi:hypothetical protein
MKSNPFLMSKPTPLFLPIVGVLLLLLVLSGCGGIKVKDDDFVPTPVTFTIKVPYKCGQPPPITHVSMRDIDWDIITVEDVDLFTLTVSDYQLLGMNTSDWIAASKQLKEQRDFYRDCITRSQQEIHDENLDAGLALNPPAE